MTEDEIELERQRQEHPTYFAQHQKLIDIENESYKISDGFIVSLASGGLGFSITLVEKIASQPNIITTLLLIGSWILFVVTIVSTVLSYQSSAKAMQRQREILDSEYTKGAGKLTKKEKYNQHTKAVNIFNTVARYSFISGVISLCFFSIINLLQKETKHDTQRSELLASRNEGNSSTKASIAASQKQVIISTSSTNISQEPQEEKSMSKDAPKNEQPKSSAIEKTKASVPPPALAIPPPPPTPKK